MAAATFQHRAFKIGDGKDIDLNGQDIILVGGKITNTSGVYPSIYGDTRLYLGVYGTSLICGVAGSTVPTINANVFFPAQKPTATAPTYVKGGLYFDTTLNKLMVGGATGWETVTSV